MTQTPLVFFGQVRQSAFDLWIKGTNRSLTILGPQPNPILIDSSDFRFDSVPVGYGNNSPQSLSLFRYYTRFMLVISEMLTDFDDLMQEIFGLTENQSRKKLSNPYLSVPNLLNYINSVCKHKVRPHKGLTKLHRCNNHLPFYFEDCGQPCPFTKPLKVGSNRVNLPDGIVLPKLDTLVDFVLNGYQILDTEFQNNRPAFDKFISDRGTPIP